MAKLNALKTIGLSLTVQRTSLQKPILYRAAEQKEIGMKYIYILELDRFKQCLKRGKNSRYIFNWGEILTVKPVRCTAVIFLLYLNSSIIASAPYFNRLVLCLTKVCDRAWSDRHRVVRLKSTRVSN